MTKKVHPLYDLLIKGGRVIDPAQNIDSMMDVAVSGTKVAAVSRDLPAKEAKKVIAAAGKTITPGLIDDHCHIYEAAVKNGAPPDAAGVLQGVTTLVDGGSAGQAIFAGMTKYVIPAAHTNIYCFIHFCSFGLSVMPELWHWRDINIEATEKLIVANPGLIKGVKLRLVGGLIANNGVAVVKLARATARKFNLPLMVHIGDPDKLVAAQVTRDVLPLLEQGDILLHLYTPQQGGVILSDGTLMPEFREAKARGVILDVGHGRNNFSFAVAGKILSEGFRPDVISSDVNAQSIYGPVYGLTVTMSKLLAMGIGLNEIIAMTTINPARVLSLQNDKGSLKPGMDADISILDIAAGQWQLMDTEKRVKEVNQLIVPRFTVKGGRVFEAGPIAWPVAIH